MPSKLVIIFVGNECVKNEMTLPSGASLFPMTILHTAAQVLYFLSRLTTLIANIALSGSILLSTDLEKLRCPGLATIQNAHPISHLNNRTDSGWLVFTPAAYHAR